jgi:hypothetical protein
MWCTTIRTNPHAADGLAGMKRTIELNRAAFPDMRLVVTAS